MDLVLLAQETAVLPPAPGGITLGLAHFIAIALVLLGGYGTLAKVIYTLWHENKAKELAIRATDKAIIPVATQIADILDDHNTLDAQRAAFMPLLQQIIDRGEPTLEFPPDLLNKLNEVADLQKQILEILSREDPHTPGSKLVWGANGHETLTTVRKIYTYIPEILSVVKELRGGNHNPNPSGGD